MLQDCFDHENWDMFQLASDNNIDVYTDTVTEFIRKCIGDVILTDNYNLPKTKTVNRWQHSRKARTTAINHSKVTGNMVEYKQCSYSLHQAIK